MKNIHLIILAGGNSSRFKPLSSKNLFKFNGENLIEEKIRNFGLIANKISVITNEDDYNEVQSYFLDNKNIRVLKQEGEGQAGAIMTAIKEDSDDFELLIINANDVFEKTLVEGFIQIRDDLFKNKKNLLTGYFLEKYFPGGYLVINSNNEVIDVIEKPGEGNEPSKYVRIVFDYFYSSNLLKDYIKISTSQKDDVYEVSLSQMMKDNVVFKHLEYKGIWKPLKYPWHLLELSEYYLSKFNDLHIDKSATVSNKAIINGNVFVGRGVKIFDGAVINGPVFIGENTIIGNNVLVRNSIIGDNCIIGGGTNIGSNVTLKKNIFVGIGAVFASKKITVNDNSYICSGSVIFNNLSKNSKVIGNPARAIPQKNK